jgi:hypothetical protein
VRVNQHVVHNYSVFAGTNDELRAEIARLKERQQTLTAADEELAAIEAEPDSDPDGTLLSLMREWRRQRLAAVAFEIERLEAIVAATSRDEL